MPKVLKLLLWYICDSPMRSMWFHSFIEGMEIKSPLKLQPQMTRWSRQPVATSLRVGERPAAMRRRRMKRRRRRRRKRASWGCCDYFIGCISERESARKNCMLQCVAREAEGERGRGGGERQLLLQRRCSCSKMACHGLLTPPPPSPPPLASRCCQCATFPHFPLHRTASRRVALLIATSAMIMWH